MREPNEAKIIAYLTRELGEHVGVERVNMDRYIVVDKAGSSLADGVEETTVVIQSYDTSAYNAGVLNERVKMAMDDFVKEPYVSSSKLNSDYNSSDTTKKEYRYQSVYEVVFF